MTKCTIFKVPENEQDIKGVIITAGEILGNTNDKALKIIWFLFVFNGPNASSRPYGRSMNRPYMGSMKHWE